MIEDMVERTPEQVDVDLADIRPQIRAVAVRRFHQQPWLLEDAEQEALVAAWDYLRQGFPKPIAIYKASQRATDMARGRRPLGSTSKGQRGQVDTHRHATHLQRTTSLGEEYVIEPPRHEGGYDEVELEQVLSVLEPDDAALVRETVLEGYTRHEAAARRGISDSTVARRLRAAKGVLLESLAS